MVPTKTNAFDVVSHVMTRTTLYKKSLSLIKPSAKIKFTLDFQLELVTSIQVYKQRAFDFVAPCVFFLLSRRPFFIIADHLVAQL